MATQKEVSEHLGITERQVRNLIQSAVLPKAKGHGGMDLDACRLAYINYVRVGGDIEIPQDEAEIEAETKRENLRLIKCRADALELKNMMDKQELLPVDLMRESLGKVASQIASILDTLPSKIKRTQPALNNSSMDQIKKEIVKAQNIAAQAGDILEEFLTNGANSEASQSD